MVTMFSVDEKCSRVVSMSPLTLFFGFFAIWAERRRKGKKKKTHFNIYKNGDEAKMSTRKTQK